MKSLLTITLFLFTLSLHAGTTVYSAPDETGLVGYWKMDEPGPTTIDYSGNGNNGTNVNGVTLVQGVIGNAGNFSGSSNFISASFAMVLTNFSLCCWFNQTTNQNGSSLITKKYTNVVPFELGFDCNTPVTANKLQLGYYANTWFLATCPVSLPNNQWIFAAGTFNGTTLSLYTNGVLCTQTNVTNIPGYEINPLFIGARHDVVGTPYFNGKIDDVRIYNLALSATEITNLYNFQQKTYLTNGTTPFKP